MYSYYCPQCGFSSIRTGKKAKSEIRSIKKKHRIAHHIPVGKKGLAEILSPTVRAFSCGMVKTLAGTMCRKGLLASLNKKYKEVAKNA